MAVINCRKCRRLFDSLTGFTAICPECRQKDEEDFKKVKSFVWDHPGVTIDEVAEICDVKPQDIKEWLREERLSLTEGSVADVLTCDKCGKPILKGRYCEKCKAELITDLKHSIEKPKLTGTLVNTPVMDENSKMRFLGTSNKKK